ncbi:hypothetical protein RUM44_006503 [Polyplax serrata]|uniref:Uncharacterized protein n=1 Tax=Polyplax serrata TaxID=468196 RepID=A0ABR1AIC9_POLSC
MSPGTPTQIDKTRLPNHLTQVANEFEMKTAGVLGGAHVTSTCAKPETEVKKQNEEPSPWKPEEEEEEEDDEEDKGKYSMETNSPPEGGCEQFCKIITILILPSTLN